MHPAGFYRLHPNSFAVQETRLFKRIGTTPPPPLRPLRPRPLCNRFQQLFSTTPQAARYQVPKPKKESIMSDFTNKAGKPFDRAALESLMKRRMCMYPSLLSKNGPAKQHQFTRPLLRYMVASLDFTTMALRVARSQTILWTSGAVISFLRSLCLKSTAPC